MANLIESGYIFKKERYKLKPKEQELYSKVVKKGCCQPR